MSRILAVSEASISEAGAIVREGGLIAYPTDTVYGLGCDPFNKEALDRLLDAKQRRAKALPVLVSRVEEGMRMGVFDHQAALLARRFWPGPLTIVVPARRSFPAAVTGPGKTLGLRVPNRQDTLQLIKASGDVIIGTSANISGKSPSRSASDALKQLGTSVDLILDGGPLAPSAESSVVKLENRHVVVIREGAISKETVIRALEPQSLNE